MICFPLRTSNKNVPLNSCLICEYAQMSGEIITTTFADEFGQLWCVTDWVNDKSHKIDPADVAREMEIKPIDIYRKIIEHFPAHFVAKVLD